MKLLRNPIVVGLLALAALALMVNSLWPMFRGRGAARRPAPSRSAAVTPAPNNPASMPDKTPLSQMTTPSNAPMSSALDLGLVQENAASWTDSPRRDPFQARAENQFGPPARDLLTLNAVWRQTSGTFAVMNNKVLGEGDTILQFRLESIESDRVWVQSLNGRESVEFKSGLSARPNSREETSKNIDVISQKADPEGR